MIRYLEHKEIDARRWDLCVEGSARPAIYATSWYLDRVHPGWGGLVMDDYRAVFPLPAGRKMGLSYVYTPFFVQQLGSFSPGEDPGSLTGRFLEAIPACFRLVDLRLNAADRPGTKTFAVISHRNLLLDLDRPYEQLRASYSSNTLRNLKKAGETGLEVFRLDDPSLVIDLFRSDRGREFPGIRKAHYLRLQKLMGDALQEGRGRVLAARQGAGKTLAAAFFIRYGRQITFLFSGNSAGGREQGAMPLVIDRLIREEAGSDRLLDFEGSDQEGLARFYGGFGAREEQYPGVYLNRLPAVIRWAKPVRP